MKLKNNLLLFAIIVSLSIVKTEAQPLNKKIVLIIEGGLVDVSITNLLNIFLGLLDGKHCLDEVCCETNKCLKEVLALISSIKGSTIIYK